MGDGLNEPYFIRRPWDYFVQYLMGATPPDNYEITGPLTRPGAPAGEPGRACGYHAVGDDWIKGLEFQGVRVVEYQ